MKSHSDVKQVVMECIEKGAAGGFIQDKVEMSTITKEKFTIDIGHTHLVEAIGYVVVPAHGTGASCQY